MSPLSERVTDMIEERGPMSVDEIAEAVAVPRRRVSNIVANLVRIGAMHACGSAERRGARGAAPGLYKLGPAPGWLPNPLPVNSVFQLGGRT